MTCLGSMNEYYKNCAFPKPTTKKHSTPKVSHETYQKVFEACKGSCALCGVKRNLELHHVLGRGKDLTDNYRYCLMLCGKCHHEVVHKSNKKYRKILLEICDELYN